MKQNESNTLTCMYIILSLSKTFKTMNIHFKKHKEKERFTSIDGRVTKVNIRLHLLRANLCSSPRYAQQKAHDRN